MNATQEEESSSRSASEKVLFIYILSTPFYLSYAKLRSIIHYYLLTIFSGVRAAPAVSSEDLHQAENSDNSREKLRKANKRGIRAGERGEKRCLLRKITC